MKDEVLRGGDPFPLSNTDMQTESTRRRRALGREAAHFRLPTSDFRLFLFIDDESGERVEKELDRLLRATEFEGHRLANSGTVECPRLPFGGLAEFGFGHPPDLQLPAFRKPDGIDRIDLRLDPVFINRELPRLSFFQRTVPQALNRFGHRVGRFLTGSFPEGICKIRDGNAEQNSRDAQGEEDFEQRVSCLLYTSPSPRD